MKNYHQKIRNTIQSLYTRVFMFMEIKILMSRFLAFVLLVSVGLTSFVSHAQLSGNWIPEGPSPITGGGVEGITDRKTIGAMSALAAHPSDPNILYASGVNGGVWKTADATNADPSWIPTLNQADAISISDLQFDPTDNTANTLVASIGRSSSIARRGSKLLGIYRTVNAGIDWSAIDGGGQLVGLNINSIAVRGSVVVISVNSTESGPTGVYRSTDTGASWTLISIGDGSGPTGLPAGKSFEMAADPMDNNRLYTDLSGINGGIFRSDNLGESWARVSDAALDGLLSNFAVDNIKMSVGAVNNVYVIGSINNVTSGIFRSADGGASWVSMDLPVVGTTGINPGRQGSFHLSIAADLTNSNIVYVGGDRQDFTNNTIGAQDFSGRLMRGDASQATGSQWVHLTHSNSQGPVGGGTANSSAPHADSRDLTWDANGELIESDDGGVFRRTSPIDNTGDWFSLNGDLQTTELHKASYDSLSGIVIAGSQDNGTVQALEAGDNTWEVLLGGDGSVTLVDSITLPNMSIRYISAQFMQVFRRMIFDSSNSFVAISSPGLVPLDGAPPLVPQFFTPRELNRVQPNRIIFGANNGIYESFDQADTLSFIGPGLIVTQVEGDAIAYGAQDNIDALYIGTTNGQIHIRSAAPPAALKQSISFPGIGPIADIVMNPDTAANAFVVTSNAVFRTNDMGVSWTNITYNLNALDVGIIRAIEYVNSPLTPAIIVGTQTGVFVAFESDDFTSWSKADAGLPTVPVYTIDYSAVDDRLTVGTLGRGAWFLSPVKANALFQDGFE